MITKANSMQGCKPSTLSSITLHCSVSNTVSKLASGRKMTVPPTTKPMMKRKGLLATALIAIVVIAAVLVYFAFQNQSASGAAPTVTQTSPVYAATGTAINTKILVTFSKTMDSSTITNSTFTLRHGTTSDSGTVSYTGVTATFIPKTNLAANTFYTATITTGAKDSSGHALAVNFVWSFTTGVLADTTAPTVIGTSPVLAVAVDSSISVTFSKAMDPSTITTSTFTVTSVSGAVTYAGTTASFKPSSNLAADTTYTATIAAGVTDLAGNALKNNFVWSFTTATSTSSCSQTAVALGSAANFAVLAGSGVTNTGPTNVTSGDLGVSPLNAVTGFPPGRVLTGMIHAGDSTAATAEGDLTTAYNNAQGLTLCPIPVAGDLGGQRLTPGLYKSTSSLAITGTLTLDAQGNANAVFIFQIASTLTTSSGAQIVLAGMAQDKNIFWAVGSSATLGTTSVFHGTVMAYQSITITTGVTLNGRALAQVAAVTMDTNTVTKPA
jgi:hypothetical protein